MDICLAARVKQPVSAIPCRTLWTEAPPGSGFVLGFRFTENQKHSLTPLECSALECPQWS